MERNRYVSQQLPEKSNQKKMTHSAHSFQRIPGYREKDQWTESEKKRATTYIVGMTLPYFLEVKVGPELSFQ